LLHRSQPLMSEDDGGRNFEVSLLEMEVRAADSAIPAGNHQPAGRNRRYFQFADDDRFAESFQNGGPAQTTGFRHRADPANSRDTRISSGLVSRPTTYSGRGSPDGTGRL